MAKPKNGILGPVSGKLGPVVAGVWNGIPYLKLAPVQKPGDKVRSEAQLANEGRMTFMNNALVPFHPFINIGFQHLAVRKTAISAAYSHNYHRALVGQFPNLSIDYSQFMISIGALPNLKSPVISLLTDEIVELRWAPNTSHSGRFDDQVMLVLYSAELHTVQGVAGGAIRRDLVMNLLLADQLIGKALEVYVSVTSFDRRKISDSLYLGTLEP